jgi:hypothetical protein
MSQRLDYARSVAALCKEIERHGFVCYLGHHGQKLVERGKSTLVFDVGLMSIQKTEGAAGTQYALVQLEGAWSPWKIEFPSPRRAAPIFGGSFPPGREHADRGGRHDGRSEPAQAL